MNRKHYIITLSAAIILALGTYSCQEASVFPSIPTTPGSGANVSEFPNTLYSYWTYELTDNYNNVIDTMDVMISSIGETNDGDSAKIWNYTSRTMKYYWMEIVSIRSNAVDITKFYGIEYSFGLKMKNFYNFPLKTGKKWIVGFSEEQDQVTSCNYEADIRTIDTLSVPAGKFFNVAKIVHPYCFMAPGGQIDTIYFCPKIGVVKEVELDQESGVMTTWKLIDYKIK